MSDDIAYGTVNPHIIGIVMKEAVRRAILAIRAQRFIFEAQAKAGYSGKLDDLVTTADRQAQAIYVKMLKECFPLCGIVAEEEDLQVECRVPGAHVFFTVDPLDGTKAFVRKQSHGIGTMISLVRDGQVAAAYVGDVMTQEIYGFRPDSPKVHRISEFDHAEALRIRPETPLASQYLLLRAAPHRYSAAIRQLAGHREEGGMFRDMEVARGSIGTGMARLWKGEVGAVALRHGHETPWDMCPIVGISQRLGFRFLRVTETGRLAPYEPQIGAGIRESRRDVLVVHSSRLEELSAFLA